MLILRNAATFERLQDALLGELMQPGDSPFAREPVLVPSTALRRHLALAVADRHGICAQVEFSFLAQWLWRQIARTVAGIPEHSPFDPSLLRWRIDACLADPEFVLSHPRLGRWLETADATMRFRLAGRLAALYDAYLTWRPDWLAAWSAGSLRASRAEDLRSREDERWQAALWRTLEQALLAGGPGARPAGHPAEDFLASLARNPGRAGLPARLHVFCIPGMPPLYLSLLAGLAQHTDVALYVLNPCREYWLDLVSMRQHARAALADQAVHLEVGHRLLAAWGRQTQAWLRLLLEQEEECLIEDLDQEGSGNAAAPPTVLGQLQEGIRSLQDPGPGALAGYPPDDSLEVHVCHSLLRELEVLQDRLLARFAAADPPLPGEVLVVVPDLEAAAPLIEQVFGTAPRSRQLPFAISGLPASRRNPLAHALLALLELARSRLPVSALIAVLQEPVVADRFDLTATDVERIGLLLRSGGVHWGFDAAHRASLHLPPHGHGSLAEGRERLWLGHALPDDHPEPWQILLPAQAVEGSDLMLLGRFEAFVAELDALRVQLQGDLVPGRWCALLDEVLLRFLRVSARLEDARAELLAGLRAHGEELHAAAGPAALPIEVLQLALQDHFDQGARGGAPTGAITFAALPSLRLLPHRIVCILGLNDGVFPSGSRPLEFDLMAAYPRQGDRQRGEDERNLFLDLLLAARESLHLSYQGRSARDNSVLPPSVVLAELLDVMVPALCPADADRTAREAMRQALVCEHPLQPFDEAYFTAAGGPLPRSFRSEFAAALRAPVAAAAPIAATAGGRHPIATDEFDTGSDEDLDEVAVAAPAPLFFTAPLPPAEAFGVRLPLARLSRFFQHPARALLRDRLGVVLPGRSDAWQDDEAFLPAREGPGRLARRLLPWLLAGDPDPGELWQRAQAGDEFPAGPPGELALQQELERLLRFAREVRSLRSVPAEPARTAELGLALAGQTWVLEGVLSNLHAGQHVGGDYVDLQVRIEIEVWIAHLWACAHAGSAAPLGVPSHWCLRGDVLRYRPVPAGAARSLLAELLALFLAGMDRPLHFYPRTARALAEGLAPGRIRSTWQGRAPHTRGEAQDPAWRLALRGVAEPLDAEFEHLAQAVFGPMLAARA